MSKSSNEHGKKGTGKGKRARVTEAPPGGSGIREWAFFPFGNSGKWKISFGNSGKRFRSGFGKRRNIVREFGKIEIFVREFVKTISFGIRIRRNIVREFGKIKYLFVIRKLAN